MRKAWQVRCRMARKIEAALIERTALDPGWTGLLSHWLRSQQLFELLSLLRAHHWPRARNAIRSRLTDQLSVVREHLHQYLQGPEWNGRLSRLHFRELVTELAELEDEFTQAELDLRKRLIKVTTDPITLEGVELGCYEILLEIDSLSETSRYTIRSRDGVMSASDASICHPHVSHGRLCEGEGRHTIAAALATGRVGDFFVIVRQILETYTSSSAYVSLEDWDGYPCGDCGDMLGDDNASSCYSCGSCICTSCTVDCVDCDEPHCSRCLIDCEDCHNESCERCMTTCVECRRCVCDYCLSEAGRCGSCEEKAANNTNLEEDTHDKATSLTKTPETATATPTEVYSNGLGQAGLAAGSGPD